MSKRKQDVLEAPQAHSVCTKYCELTYKGSLWNASMKITGCRQGGVFVKGLCQKKIKSTEAPPT